MSAPPAPARQQCARADERLVSLTWRAAAASLALRASPAVARAGGLVLLVTSADMWQRADRIVSEAVGATIVVCGAELRRLCVTAARAVLRGMGLARCTLCRCVLAGANDADPAVPLRLCPVRAWRHSRSGAER